MAGGSERRRAVVSGLACLAVLACARDGLRVVSEGKGGAYEASLRALDDGFAVAWHDYRDGNAEIYLRVLDPDGHPAGLEHRLTRTAALSFEPDLETADGDLIVAWYERQPHAGSEARVGRWTIDGDWRWEVALPSPTSTGRNPVARVVGDRIFCAWLDGRGDDTWVRGRWLDLAGEPLSHPWPLARAGSTTWNLNATTVTDREVWVVFDATAGTRTDELFLVRVDRSTSDLVALTADDGVPSKYPDIATDGSRVALTWFDERDGNREVYLTVAPLPLIGAELERRARRVTVSPGESIGAYVAWNATTVGLAWSDELDGQHDVFFQAFTAADGTTAGPRRVTRNPTASLIPSIRAAADGFALAWNEDVIAERGTHLTGGSSSIVFTLVE